MLSIKQLPDAGKSWRRATLQLIVALAVGMPLSSPTTTEGADQSSQCMSCHTEAAKLKALTPPDPPPTEEGEG